MEWLEKQSFLVRKKPLLSSGSSSTTYTLASGTCSSCGKTSYQRFAGDKEISYGYCPRCGEKVDSKERDNSMRISVDKETADWFIKHPNDEVTMLRCEKCGKFYKSSFSHACEKVCGLCAYLDLNNKTSIGCYCTCKSKRFAYNASRYKTNGIKACKYFKERSQV